ESCFPTFWSPDGDTGDAAKVFGPGTEFFRRKLRKGRPYHPKTGRSAPGPHQGNPSHVACLPDEAGPAGWCIPTVGLDRLGGGRRNPPGLRQRRSRVVFGRKAGRWPRCRLHARAHRQAVAKLSPGTQRGPRSAAMTRETTMTRPVLKTAVLLGLLAAGSLAVALPASAANGRHGFVRGPHDASSTRTYTGASGRTWTRNAST